MPAERRSLVHLPRRSSFAIHDWSTRLDPRLRELARAMRIQPLLYTYVIFRCNNGDKKRRVRSTLECRFAVVNLTEIVTHKNGGFSWCF